MVTGDRQHARRPSRRRPWHGGHERRAQPGAVRIPGRFGIDQVTAEHQDARLRQLFFVPAHLQAFLGDQHRRGIGGVPGVAKICDEVDPRSSLPATPCRLRARCRKAECPPGDRGRASGWAGRDRADCPRRWPPASRGDRETRWPRARSARDSRCAPAPAGAAMPPCLAEAARPGTADLRSFPSRDETRDVMPPPVNECCSRRRRPLGCARPPCWLWNVVQILGRIHDAHGDEPVTPPGSPVEKHRRHHTGSAAPGNSSWKGLSAS